MTTALLKSIDIIDEILKACDDVSVFANSTTSATGGAPLKSVPSEVTPKQGKKEKKKKAAKPDAATSSGVAATQDPMASADLRVRLSPLILK